MRTLILTGCTLLLSLVMGAQTLPQRDTLPFRAGERLEMGIRYRWGAVMAEVGQAVLRLEQEDSLFHAECAVRSAPFFDVFYRMREHFQSWFTPGEIRPMEAVRDTYQNGYTAANHFRYDWEQGCIRAQVAYNGLPPEQKNIPLDGYSYDIVSLIYFLRAVDWNRVAAGEPRSVPFAIDDAVFRVQVTCHGPERFKVRRLGWRDTLRFSCTVVSGALFSGDQQMQVWFSADEKHVPLAVMVPLKVGTMWAWLKSYEQGR